MKHPHIFRAALTACLSIVRRRRRRDDGQLKSQIPNPKSQIPNLPLTACLSIAMLLATGTAARAQVPFGVETKLKASDAAFLDRFGWSVGIDGNTAIVGAPTDDDACPLDPRCDSGSAYLFDAITGNQLFKLTASDAAEGDDFGHSAGISGNTAIVGAGGGAYLFDVTTGLQRFKLTASDATFYRGLGNVGISGNTAIVATITAQAAYLFDVTTGDQLFKLTASDAAEPAAFGWSAAIDGNTAIVGAVGGVGGSAYLFNVTTGEELFKLTANDAAEGDDFGWSVAIDGNTAIVGAVYDRDEGWATGSAYLFDVTTGEQLFKLTASEVVSGDFFGWSAAISGNTAIVGGGPTTDRIGAAYLFDVTTGDQFRKLTAPDLGRPGRRIVGISGNTAIVGAVIGDNLQQSGVAYLFTAGEPPADRTRLAGTSFEEAAVGALEYRPGPGARELGFTRRIDANNDGTFGDEDAGGVYGVVAASSNLTGLFTDGSQGYETTGSNGGAALQPHVLLTFDAVDVSQASGVELSLDVFVAVRGYETNDLLKVWVEATRGGQADLLSVIERDGDQIDAGDGISQGQWNTFRLLIDDDYQQATLRIETSTNATSLGEGFLFDNILFAGLSPLLSSDLTGNGFVDFEDLTVLLANWNKNVGADAGNLVNAGTTPVNFEDLTVLLADWTGPGPAGSPEAALGTEAVPEPSTLALGMIATSIGLLTMRRRRRRDDGKLKNANCKS